MLAFLQDMSAGCMVVLRPPEEGERKDRDGEEDGEIPPKTVFFLCLSFVSSFLGAPVFFGSNGGNGIREPYNDEIPSGTGHGYTYRSNTCAAATALWATCSRIK